jgi:hypothetical protein
MSTQSSRHTPCAVSPAVLVAGSFPRPLASGGRHTECACYFALQLTADEAETMRSQFVTANLRSKTATSSSASHGGMAQEQGYRAVSWRVGEASQPRF